MNINLLRDKLVSSLGEDLVCLIHMGSRVRGEARANSDYDFALIISEINKEVLDDIRDVLSDFSNISVYILDEQDACACHATHLQFVYSEKIYGDFDFPKPSAEDIDTYSKMMRDDELFTVRHYLTLPHEPSELVRRIALRLKNVYFYLTYLIYKETDTLPKTRLETIDYLQKKDSQKLGIALLRILENWPTQEELVAKRPRQYLHMLEEFWRSQI